VAGVTLTVVADEVEAEMVCGLFRSHGIACTSRKTNPAAAIGAESGGWAIAGPTEVLVDEHDRAAAQKLLKTA
jgi:Putative prokaryotic signal transducing protein